MDTRKRLIELLLKCDNDPNLAYYDMSEITDKMMGGAEYLADYLIENGVTFTKKISPTDTCPGRPALVSIAHCQLYSKNVICLL